MSVFSECLLAQHITFDSVSKSPQKLVQIDSMIKVSKKDVKHSASLAAILSAGLPGLGQAYNKKYWKIPIVWAGLSGFGFGWISNANEFSASKKAYQSFFDEDTANFIAYKKYTDRDQIKSLQNGFKSQMDMFILLTVAWYTMNIIDATVDAHLFKFDVSDDMSLEWRPNIFPTMQSMHASLDIQLHLNHQSRKMKAEKLIKKNKFDHFNIHVLK